MFVDTFITRPILATVCSLVIVLAGALAIPTMPIAQYPEVAPPTISITANFPGANALDVAENVAQPIEQEVNGVENMIYMLSKCTNDGQMILDVTFTPGTDAEMAQVQVQNRVAQALPRLPQDVQRIGVTTEKASPDFLLVAHLVSPDDRYDMLYLSNYALLQVKDELARVPGVGSVQIFGAGESFTRLNKRGQKLVMYLRDGQGVQNYRQYKAVPVFLSSNGYGMFAHTSAPVTFDFGHDFDQHTVIYTGDDVLDLFVFLGRPKDILGEYTALTGRSPVPPLWSFGLWMSRITYQAEAEVREVAAKLRQYLIPSDVIHLDTGWFETDWQSDYQFSTTRFTDPAAMMRDLAKMGFHVSLWQYPYFTRKNKVWDELLQGGFAVRDEAGRIGSEDATLDFSNPEAVRWYQGKLESLLDLGADAIKADFGEGAPLTGLYHSGRTGWYEHNLYPVRYNRAVHEVTKNATGGGIIWARSAWAGSQRYPVHWGGDGENTNSAMAATVRGGLSLGLSGFTFWSHDIGGFEQTASADVYKRWTAFGLLSSHSRLHGSNSYRVPWHYDDEAVAVAEGCAKMARLLAEPAISVKVPRFALRGRPTTLAVPLRVRWPLASGVPVAIAKSQGWDILDAERAGFVAYMVVGVIVALLYGRLSEQREASVPRPGGALATSRSFVLKLSAVFAIGFSHAVRSCNTSSDRPRLSQPSCTIWSCHGLVIPVWDSKSAPPTFYRLECIETYACIDRRNVPLVWLRCGLVRRAPRRSHRGHAGTLPVVPARSADRRMVPPDPSGPRERDGARRAPVGGSSRASAAASSRHR